MNYITCFSMSAVCLVLATVCFRINQPNRAAIDVSLAQLSRESLNVPDTTKSLKVPERKWPSYNAAYLNRFISAAAAQPVSSGKSALELYIRPTLLWIDVGFAVFCAGFAALFWVGLLKVLPDYPLIKHLMAFFISMSLLYGVADVAEDLWLARLFTKDGQVTKAEGWIACALTETKLVTISLSVAGGLLFKILQLTFPEPAA